jgi:hypothetical protein
VRREIHRLEDNMQQVGTNRETAVAYLNNLTILTAKGMNK